MKKSLKLNELRVRRCGLRVKIQLNAENAETYASLKTILLSRQSFAVPPFGGKLQVELFDDTDLFTSFFFQCLPPRVGAAGGILSSCFV